MNRPTNTAVKIAGIALALSCLAGGLAGCGGSDSDSDGGSAADTPKGASKDGFCEKFQGMYSALGQSDPKDPSAAIKGVKSWAVEMADYGTPSEMDDAARDGAALLIATFKDIDESASLEELQKVGGDFSAAENKKVNAFGAWVNANCAPSAAPSDDAS